MTYQVLNIGAGIAKNPVIKWAAEDDTQFTRLDANPYKKPDILHDIYEPLPEHLCGRFDCVFASHVMEHIEWKKVGGVMGNIARAAKENGILVIIVPDLAYACKAVLQGTFNLGILCSIYGGQYNPLDFHKIGFTKDSMTEAMRLIGWHPFKQYSEAFTVAVDGNKDESYQIVTMAVRDGQAAPGSA